MKFNNLIILFLLVFFCSCHKDEIFYNEDVSKLFTAKIYEEVNGSVIGYVYDENNKPVSGAEVETYSSTTTTNNLGIFILKNIKMDKQGTYIRVTKTGYIFGSDRLYPDKAAVHSYIKMFRDIQDKNFAASSGGLIQLTGGGSISFQPNSIKRINGEDYNGDVKLTARFIDPTSSSIGDEMPGGLIGIDFQGSTVVLGTAGMFVVEMKAANGGKLNLKDGSRAKFRIPAKSSSKPETIALWSFDEGAGVWKEEGLARLEGNEYVGEVSHFSFWNCDAPFPLVHACGGVVDQNGNPIVNAQISIAASIGGNELGVGFGYTDEVGRFCGKIPKGAILKINVTPFGCNSNSSVTVTVGPFDNDVVLNDIVINLDYGQVSGTIKCNGVPIENGYIVLKQDDKTAIIPASGGTFNFNLEQYFCTAGANLQILAFNGDDNKSSIIQVFDPNNLNYDFELCNLICNLNADFINICGPMTINVSGGSGNYSYLWSNGLTTATIPLDSAYSSIYSVTVTDVENPTCMQVFSKNIPGKLQVKIFSGNCSSPYYLYVQGVNYSTIQWSTGETGQTIKVSPGSATEYIVTVTNAEGCEASDTILIDPSQTIYVSSQPVSCSQNLYSLDGMFDAGTLNSGQPYNFTKILTGPQDLINLNVFQTGYFIYGSFYNSNCQNGFEMQLPNLESLTVTNLSDEITLIGNKIEYITAGSCYNCTEGSVAIYAEGDLNTNLIIQNNTTGLAAGTYYVVVPDASTGCFVAHKKVKIL